MKTIYFSLVTLFFFSTFALAQNKMVEGAPFQKTVRFNTGISKDKAITSFSKKNGLDVANTTFESVKETSDETGMVHQRHQQFYKGVKIEYGTVITHSRNQYVESVNGEVYNASSLNLTPT